MSLIEIGLLVYESGFVFPQTVIFGSKSAYRKCKEKPDLVSISVLLLLKSAFKITWVHRCKIIIIMVCMVESFMMNTALFNNKSNWICQI